MDSANKNNRRECDSGPSGALQSAEWGNSIKILVVSQNEIIRMDHNSQNYQESNLFW